MIGQLAAAFGLLTRLPVGRFRGAGGGPDQASCIWAYPVAGAAVGALGGGVFWVGVTLGMTPLLSAGWALAALVLATGGLHEDGLADTADGFGGGATRERKLEILRDSRIGSFGAIALILSLGIRAAAIAASATPIAAMIVSGALGRAAMIAILLALKPARTDGMAASLGRVAPTPAAIGLALAMLATVCLLSPPMALRAMVLTLASLTAMAMLAKRQIGGYTGDVLGATETVVECVVLSGLAV